MNQTVRLSKSVADQFSCSRREAENYIEGGWVRVDGQIIQEPGFRIRPEQSLELAENASAEDHIPATILLHKPVGYGSAARPALDLIVPQSQYSDEHLNRQLVKRDLAGSRIFMPLEEAASGLIVFTQDPRIATKLHEDVSRLEHECVVEVTGQIDAEGLQMLAKGLSWQGVPPSPMKVSWQSESRLRFALKNLAPGLLQYMCRAVGLEVVSIKRIRIGRVPMAGLAPGQWRYLSGYERF